MRIPLSLIKEFIDIDLTPSEIAEKLTLLGLEVDAVYNETPSFSGVVVAEIRHAEKHPNADSLNLLKVFDGEEEVQIVCGDQTTKAGQKVALAKIGAKITDDERTFTIKKAKLRGMESFGMLSSAKELGLAEEAEFVLRFDEDALLGEDVAEKISEPIFEISLTPNLGHCQSVLGIARELAAFLQLPLKIPSLPFEEGSLKKIRIEAKDACPRYSAKVVKSVRIKPSPFWLRMALEKAGIRAIDNAVDVTNYTMLLFGQPMHAFDLDLLEGEEIIIKKSTETHSLETLDGKTREIPKGSLLIHDAKKPIALAGIMGGQKTAVHKNTKNILFEAAYFDAITVRKTASKVGLRSESSMRFEKGIDPNFTPHALTFAAHLMESLSGGKAEKKIVEEKTQEFLPKKILCRLSWTNQMIGIKIGLTEMEEIFHRLGFSTRAQKTEALSVDVPYFRHDITQEIDLIEEVARIYGYNNIERKSPLYVGGGKHHPVYLLETEIRKRAVAEGLTEFLTPDLISPTLAEITEELSLQKKDMLKVLHSKSEDHSILRSTLLPSLLQVVKHNQNMRNFDLSGFEIGRIHFMKKDTCIEQTMLGVLLTGEARPHFWGEKTKECDFYDLSGMVENILSSQRIKDVSLHASKHPSFHPTRQADVFVNGEDIGALGEMHPKILHLFDLKQKVFYAEINLTSLLHLEKIPEIMKELPQYPASERDWTITLKNDLPYSVLLKALEEITSSLLEKAYLRDLFTSEKLGDKKNATIRFVYRDTKKTLSFEEVEKEHAKVQRHLSKALGVTI